jgi:hypothetical protein
MKSFGRAMVVWAGAVLAVASMKSDVRYAGLGAGGSLVQPFATPGAAGACAAPSCR